MVNQNDTRLKKLHCSSWSDIDQCYGQMNKMTKTNLANEKSGSTNCDNTSSQSDGDCREQIFMKVSHATSGCCGIAVTNKHGKSEMIGNITHLARQPLGSQ